jgi:hypothetical protein
MNVLEQTRKRFDKLIEENNFEDEANCRELDYLGIVSLNLNANNYTIRRLTFALATLAKAVEGGDPEAIRKGMLWARHHLDRYGDKSERERINA